jgi:hypothetical protein
MSEWARMQRDREASCLKYATDLPDLHQRTRGEGGGSRSSTLSPWHPGILGNKKQALLTRCPNT